MEQELRFFTDDDFRFIGLRFCDDILSGKYISRNDMLDRVRTFRDYFDRF